MKTRISFALFSTVVFLSACASFQAGTEVTAGRQAFLMGNNEAALSYFQRAAQKDPNYTYGTALRQGIWSYIGRAEYATGKYPQARQSLERALSQDSQDNMARLYLGFTLARGGDQQTGLLEIQNAMKGLYDSIEHITQVHRFSFGRFWDARREIRSEIQSDLAMISGKEVDWQKLITDGEWLGKRVEKEIDLAREDEAAEFRRQGGDGNQR